MTLDLLERVVWGDAVAGARFEPPAQWVSRPPRRRPPPPPITITVRSPEVRRLLTHEPQR